MTTTLVTGIGLLATQTEEHGELRDAALVIDAKSGVRRVPRTRRSDADERVDVGGRAVLPGFVDSHAHLVFAGDRAEEFAARMSGQPYAAGGIRTTVAATRAASDDQLRATVQRLAAELLHAGVTTFETKSGYGLDVATEQRSLRIAREFTPETTYLGAHVVPPGCRPLGLRRPRLRRDARSLRTACSAGVDASSAKGRSGRRQRRRPHRA